MGNVAKQVNTAVQDVHRNEQPSIYDLSAREIGKPHPLDTNDVSMYDLVAIAQITRANA